MNNVNNPLSWSVGVQRGPVFGLLQHRGERLRHWCGNPAAGTRLESTTVGPGAGLLHRWCAVFTDPPGGVLHAASHTTAHTDAPARLTALLLPPCRYLEEVGYTDTILDMRSKRVRSLLGRSLELSGASEPSELGV